MTEAEKVFWGMVRGRKMFGLKFRRQQVIDGFIVDFYCDSLGLCVEIDGSVHESEEQREYDRNRDEVLALRGLKVLRFSNDEVLGGEGFVEERLRAFF
jgi:very-short-patch-repair endonuclease